MKMMVQQEVKRYMTKNNDLVWVSINASTVRNESKEPVYFVTQIENIMYPCLLLSLTADGLDSIEEGIAS